MERMTSRAFRARFSRIDRPVLVGDGIWFPYATAELMAIAEGDKLALSSAAAAVEPASSPSFTVDAVSTKTVARSTAKRPLPDASDGTTIHQPFRKITDLSKTAQAKGKMGR